MESMWKSRKPPTVLDFDSIATDAAGIDKSMAHQDQKEWSLAENFSVFYDRYSSSKSIFSVQKADIYTSTRRLAARLQAAQDSSSKDDAPAILTFDKDDVDTLDFVAASANIRAFAFGIPVKSKFEIKREISIPQPKQDGADGCRNGRKYHPGNCDHERYDGGSLCPPSV